MFSVYALSVLGLAGAIICTITLALIFYQMNINTIGIKVPEFKSPHKIRVTIPESPHNISVTVPESLHNIRVINPESPSNIRVTVPESLRNIKVTVPVSPDNIRVTIPESSHFICPLFRGGLGNLMYMYASLYGIAQTKKMYFVLNDIDHVNTVFPNLRAIKLEDTTFCDKANLREEEKPCVYDKSTFNFNRTHDVRLKAYLQSWKYFENVEDDLRKQFVFQRPVQEKATKVIERYTALHVQRGGTTRNLTIIGVHIRRGDFLRPSSIRYGYNVATKDYIQKAFHYFRSKFNNCLFLVFTGPSKADKKWREKNIQKHDFINVEINQRDVDMCSLSMCNQTIITVGSFEWWSAWLANGITVYFKNVAKEKRLQG